MTDPTELPRLLADLRRSRAEHREALHGRVESPRVAASRFEVLMALEAYVAALAHRGFPLPPEMRSELALLRNLCAPARRRT